MEKQIIDYQQLSELIGDLQSSQIVHSWILKEIIIDLANTFSDPNVYLENKYEKLSKKADEIDLEKEFVSGAIRYYVDEIFSYARANSKLGK